MKKWFVSAKKADFTEIGKKFNITPMTARIIRNRDVVGDEQIRRYLHGTVEDLYSPWELFGMREGIQLLQQAIAAQEKIRVIANPTGASFGWSTFGQSYALAAEVCMACDNMPVAVRPECRCFYYPILIYKRQDVLYRGGEQL